ncbi:MAG: M23 family metallopeptidase [Clostridia bacterium]|nr:M23 family metallopeptidase [Clostridia bacterium]
MIFRQPFKGGYPITQRYGEKITNLKGHTGIDYACPARTPVLASGDGTVMYAGWDPTGYGLCVILRHSAQCATLYAHLSLIPQRITAGVSVKQGEEIGLSGSTGNSTGPHLHFEARSIWNNYQSHFDPMLLPLTSVDDAAFKQQKPEKRCLKAADELDEAVLIVAPAGAWGWSQDFSSRQTVYPCGTRLHFTGRTTERLGYTYCEVYPEPAKYWVAVHDGTTQILDNA